MVCDEEQIVVADARELERDWMREETALERGLV